MSGDPDTIVIGAGLGGLAAAATLARNGRAVLLLEAQDGPGGYAHAFHRGPYTFDPAVHVTAQAREGQVLSQVLGYLGVADRCRFIDLEHVYEARFPGLRVEVISGPDGFFEAHARRFPAEAENLRRFLTLCETVQRELGRLAPSLGLSRIDEAVKEFPSLFAYRRATLGAVLDEHLQDGRLKAAVAALWPYLGLPPSRLSFIQAAQVLVNLPAAPSYCEGGFESLAKALAEAVVRAGGEVRYGQRAGRILVEAGRVAGVVTESGDLVRARTVISNADARTTFLKLVGEENLPATFQRRLARMTESVSAFIVFAATREDPRSFTSSHELFLSRHWDHDQTYSDILAGRPGGMWVNLPSTVDPSLAPPGEHLLVFTSLAVHDALDWKAHKDEFAADLVSRFESEFPGMTQHLTYQEAASPQTLERFSGNWHGAMYGWENSPRHTGSGRLSHETVVPGLYLAGHWTHPGSGSLRATVSGMLTAKLVIAAAGGVTADLDRTVGLPPIPV